MSEFEITRFELYTQLLVKYIKVTEKKTKEPIKVALAVLLAGYIPVSLLLNIGDLLKGIDLESMRGE